MSAIDYLQELKKSQTGKYAKKWLEEAIEALEQEPKTGHWITKVKSPEEKITYSAICEQLPIPHLYFKTYKEAEDYAKDEQPAYRPYYIVERVEHFEICGVVGD